MKTNTMRQRSTLLTQSSTLCRDGRVGTATETSVHLEAHSEKELSNKINLRKKVWVTTDKVGVMITMSREVWMLLPKTPGKLFM